MKERIKLLLPVPSHNSLILSVCFLVPFSHTFNPPHTLPVIDIYPGLTMTSSPTTPTTHPPLSSHQTTPICSGINKCFYVVLVRSCDNKENVKTVSFFVVSIRRMTIFLGLVMHVGVSVPMKATAAWQ